MTYPQGYFASLLTDLKIRAARAESMPFHLTDGHGLFLAVQTSGSKLWRWKYRYQGNIG